MCEEIEFEIQEEDIPLTMDLKDDVYLVEPKTENLEVTPTKETQYFDSEMGIYYDNVTVNKIPDEYIIPNLGTKTITTNGTYNASNDNLDGYSQVSVETSGVDINDYFTDTIKNGNTNEGGWVNCIKKLKSPLTVSGTSGYYMFGMYRASEIPVIDTSNITYMSCMFIAATGLTSLDLNYWNTSKVNSMSSMFKTCTNLTDLKIGNWDTSNVEDMSSMFQYSSKLTNLDLSKWNTSKVKTMNSMFAGCSGLTSLDLSNFDTSNLTSAQQMFNNCSKLMNLDIRNFDFTNVTSYSNMFNGVPTDCLIIVKDDTAKEWITSKFTTLTNVKTVAEL